MAHIEPFRGIRYNTHKIADLSQVIGQPYDRIDDELQQRYYEQSPYHIVRLIWGQAEPGDRPEEPDGPNVYTRAQAYYAMWRDQEILTRESTPSIYVFHQKFTYNGQRLTRKGLICALELTPFSEGIVLPHERTHAGPKLDRLRLTRTTQLDLGQAFILYPDAENRVNALLDAAIDGRPPDLDAVELFERDVRQQLWTLDDPAVIAAVQAELAAQRGLIIADGHHRYETALAYRDEMHARYPNAPANAAFNFKMVTLVSMQDPGLVILPTHREIWGWPISGAQLLERAAALFEVVSVGNLSECLAQMHINRRRHAIGLYAENGFHVLVMRDPTQLEAFISGSYSVAWKSLDVSILHRIVLEQLVGLPVQAVERQTHIRYHRDPRPAIENVEQGKSNLLFLLNPTAIEQVRACAQAGEPMPQKSTDFYPKMIAGLTIMPVSADETIP